MNPELRSQHNLFIIAGLLALILIIIDALTLSGVMKTFFGLEKSELITMLTAAAAIFVISAILSVLIRIGKIR